MHKKNKLFDEHRRTSRGGVELDILLDTDQPPLDRDDVFVSSRNIQELITDGCVIINTDAANFDGRACCVDIIARNVARTSLSWYQKKTAASVAQALLLAISQATDRN